MRLTFEPVRFFGRRSVVASLVLGINSTPFSSFLITGFKFIGKTSLWKYLVHDRGARDEFSSLWTRSPTKGAGDMAFIYADFRHFPEDGNIFSLLLHKLAENRAFSGPDGGSARPGSQGQSIQEAADDLRDALERICDEDMAPVFCLDHFDGVVRRMTPEDERAFLVVSEFASFIVMLEDSPVELNPGLDTIDKSPLFGPMEKYSLELLSLEEAVQLITEPLVGLDTRFGHSEQAFLLASVGRHAHLLTLACERLFELYRRHPDARVGKSEGLDSQIAEDLYGQVSIKDVLHALWKRLSLEEHELLYQIASDGSANLKSKGLVLGRLRHKSLVVRNYEEGTNELFCDFFREFVIQEYKHSPTPQHMTLSGHHRIQSSLAPLERGIFDYLYGHAGKTCSSEELYREFWDGASNRGALAAAISRIRSRIRDVWGMEWDYIRNIRGKGYQFVLPQSEVEKPNS
jgi:DNA-binding winged helix-turn-helix (wHTH) protein